MSDAGKTLMVAAFCRLLTRRGYSVAPFKPQNMALNSAVTVDGGEIGRAQAMQAMACGLEPHSDMNPVLLKPSSDTGAQVIVHGKVHRNIEAGDYQNYKQELLNAVLESHARLSKEYDLIVVEGAGSPAEINLRENDIANMGFAEAVDCPVILVGDIDRGGVFAQFVGTLELLSTSERERIIGFIVNKFRGNLGLLKPGLDWLEARTHKPVLGVVPYIHGLNLEAEDALPRLPASATQKDNTIRVLVPALPRISNHTDFDALRSHPQVDFEYVGPDALLKRTSLQADLIVLPGSKNTRADLAWLRQQGWQEFLNKHLRYGGKLIGICGGLQMLGTKIHDPKGIEGTAGSSAGFGFLEIESEITQQKTLAKVAGYLCFGNAKVEGYEIHMGISSGPGLRLPATVIDNTKEGCRSDDEQIFATYVHGLFDHPEALSALLKWAGLHSSQTYNIETERLASLDRLADTLETSLDPSLVKKLNLFD